MCLAQGHNAVTPVRFEPAALRSRVTLPLSYCAPIKVLLSCDFISLKKNLHHLVDTFHLFTLLALVVLECFVGNKMFVFVSTQ